MVRCPLAEFGCTSELPYDKLLEHYSTRIHQETLLRTIEIFVRQLHTEPCNICDQLNLDKYEYSKIFDSLNIFAEGVSCLHDDTVEIHTNLVQIHSNVTEQGKQIEQLKKSIDETSQLLHATQMNNSILQAEIEIMKQTLADSSSLLSNDGSYIWKITNVADKLANAISDRQTSVYSPPFYSSPTGYKMCMRLYFNGDGNARGTHLSLFFVLMRGDYDAILVWPFPYKITFSMYDQTGNQRHIIDSFRPDIKSNSFQRPRSNMNIASGIPKFFPLTIIHQENNPYVRDDCMFIRCMVDFAALPKQCIPYVVNLNPGLPLATQQSMIQVEVQKQRSALSTESTVMESLPKKDDLKINQSN